MHQAGRGALLETFRCGGGRADVWRDGADADALAAVVAGLVQPWRSERISKVVGIDSPRFLLGGAAAISLGAGFVAVREASLLPGPEMTAETAADYPGLRHLLRMQSVLGVRDRVLLVDDWAEGGSQACAARELVESCGATFAGVAVLVDQLDPGPRAALGRVTSLMRADELRTPDPARDSESQQQPVGEQPLTAIRARGRSAPGMLPVNAHIAM
ncbi:phosphoribosyltransferase [Pseudonocardia acidicola]|uniref:phosphoribosyltransferase n=1 Tax=Pseudonocardia acidicola TaxID=2724939 RepID=UPI001B7D17DE|nr:phosphoribosyltransferase [Pseudonocardia acidicola]